MFLISLVLSAVLLDPFVLLYGYLDARQSDLLHSAGRLRFGIIGGPLVSAIAIIGSIATATRIGSIQTPLGTVKYVALVDAFALVILLGVAVGIGSTVWVFRSSPE